jgi:hypothetical protein
MKTNYWDYNQEEYVFQWLSANTRQQFNIYSNLYKSVRHMATQILHRYFIPTSDFDEVRDDAVNHLFCRMHKFNPELGYTAYSYCQTILKNYYHEVCRNKTMNFTVKIEYIDDILNPEFEYSYSYDPFQEEQQYDFDPIFKRLERARYTLLSYLQQHKHLQRGTRKMVEREAEFIGCTTEFLYDFKDSQGLTAQALMENAMIKVGVSEAVLNKLLRKHFGITTNVSLTNRSESVVDEKYGLNYIDDDNVPIDKVQKKMMRRKKINLVYRDLQANDSIYKEKEV